MPTEEELSLIREAKALSPNAPLAPAELCLLTMGEIPHLSSRLQLWAFALDYDTLERVRFGSQFVSLNSLCIHAFI